MDFFPNVNSAHVTLLYLYLRVTDADYADDIAAFGSSAEGLQETTDLIADFGREAGFKINASKTQVMFINKHHAQQPYPRHITLDIKLDDQQLASLASLASLALHLPQIVHCLRWFH